MKRRELEHVLRASAAITGAQDFILIGSQAILGQFPEAPADLLESNEIDLFTMRSPEDANLIDGSIGEGSPFHQTFGYHAHGVGIETATLPRGWRERLLPVRSSATQGATGWALEAHDPAISKLVAGREKDLAFIEALVRHEMVRKDTLRERMGQTELAPAMREACESRLGRL